jgi:hypothetical protein
MEESVSAQQPDDLITAAEAATRAAKSKASIRNWVRIGKLTGYRKDPKISNSALMVSQAELLAYLAINGKITKPNTQGRKPELTASLDALHEEKKKLQEKLATMTAKLEHQKQLTDMKIAGLEKEQRQASEHIESLRSTIEALSKSLEIASKKEGQLLAYVTLPWWKRMTSSLLLTG